MSAAPPPPPRRSLGQHFLVSGAAIRRIVDALAPRRDEPVLEIGPGRGALTRPLLAAGARVVAVERDRRLAARLRDASPPGLTVVEADVLAVDLRALAREHADGRPLAVVGNLPYNISKPIAMRLVRERDAIDRAVLMFQREVAGRLTAAPGSRRDGPLGVLTGAVYTVEPLFELGPGAFRPRPQVTSSVTRWTPRRDAPDQAELDALARCLAVSFAARRRTLRNNLRRALGDDGADRALAAAALDGARRAESLAPPELARLAAVWPTRPASAP